MEKSYGEAMKWTGQKSKKASRTAQADGAGLRLSKRVFCAVFCCVLLLASGCAPSKDAGGNYTEEMKIPHTVDLEEYGADSIERQGDHPDSPYFSRLDYYNMESTDTLTILTHFKTHQQTSEWSCGVSSALMVLDWYGKLGEYNEETLAMYRDNELTPEATSLKQELEIFEGVGGFDLYSTYDCQDTAAEMFNTDFVLEQLSQGHPIIVGWNDFGGHWQVIIGYDTMGTEDMLDDVIIVADPYDATDHNQDGYGTYAAGRFFYNFTFYDYFDEGDLNDTCFVVAVPAEEAAVDAGAA